MLMGVAIVPALVFGILSFHIPNRIVHWWSCNSGATGTPTWAPDGREIAFAQRGRCDAEIVVVRRDGSDRRVVTSGFADWPAWSPDGSEILVNTHNGYGVVPASGGRVKPIRLGESDFGAAWSPDGSQIAFTYALLPGAGGDYEATLYVMRHNGTGVRRLIGHSCDPGAPAWSPDGKSIAVGCYDGLYVLSVKSARRQKVLAEPFGFEPPTPSWSPDGRTLALLYAGVEIVRSDGSAAPRTLIAAVSQSWADTVEWSHDGKWIAFSGKVGTDGDGIYVARSDGRGVRRIANLR